jgi:hypothetical protein
MTIDHLAAQYMIPLRRSVMSAFMMRDGEFVEVDQLRCLKKDVLLQGPSSP